MEIFLTCIKNKYRNWFDNHGQKQYPPCYSSRLVKLNLAVKRREVCDSNINDDEHDTNIVKQTQLVPYCDLFKREKQQRVRIVLIEGSAGIGKSAFCTSISEDWANDKLFQEFQVLLMLPLHQKEIAAISSLSELIKTLQGNANPLAVDCLKKTNGQGVLIVADGWDKLGESNRLEGTFLHSLLFGPILSLACIIVTSRPSYSDWLYASGCIGKYVSISGFDDENIREYIKLNFASDQQTFNQMIDCNPLIKSMCRIPLNCATLRHLRHTESSKEILDTTMTKLCTKMILNVVLRSIKKWDECSSFSHLPTTIESLPDELKHSWWDMCLLAFNEIQNSQDFSSQLKSSMVTFGLAEIVNQEKCKKLYFLHPILKEYLAALHVVNQCPDALKEQIRSLDIKAFDKRFPMFWRFFFGICGRNNSNLELLKQVILSLSKFDHLRFLICHCAFEASNSVIDKAAIEALSTPSYSKHFGDPHSAHDCDAILYVIHKMKSLEAGVELNFKACNLRERQLRTLRKTLASKDSKLKVKSLDLSDNHLQDERVADLFRRASTAFQSLQKLSLRNNRIGQKGNTATMSALSSLKYLIQLDLSFNRLNIVGLDILHANVKHDSLAYLEILLLQASLTTNAKENIQYLSTFTQSLSLHCLKLREFDISSNDLGKPGSPSVCALICTLTGLKLHVNKEYESEVDNNFIRTMEDLVRRQETVDHTVVHGVIVGPGRSGKNSLMDRLMGNGPRNPDLISSSTGVLDNIIKVEVKKLCTIAAAANKLKWKRLDYDEEALELMMITVKTHIASFNMEEMEPEPVPECIARLSEHDNVPSAVILVENENESDSESESDSEIKEEIAVPIVAKGAVVYKEVASLGMQESYSKEFNLREKPVDIFKRAVELRQRMHALREHLESSWSLYLTNTGGQLEFQELLPLLVCGPSVFFITFPLNKNLHEHYTVQYQYPDGREKTYPSSSTLMDEILQTLATIAGLDCAGPQSKVNLRPKVFFVGTHKDTLAESSADDIIKQTDRLLQERVKQTSLFDQESIEYAVGTDQLMFTVNNLDKDDDDFQKIRSALQRLVERRKEFTIQCPCSWLVFSLVLRAKHKSSQILSYNDCFTIAQNCGITSRMELNRALLFIHHRLGLVRYFCVEGLNDFVILDPQVVFDTITKLIVETFISDHATVKEIEEFQKRGIFSMEVMEAICLKCYSDSQLPFKWVLKLLNYLGIATFFTDPKGQKKCFFPSVLCHAPEQQDSVVSDCLIKPPPPILIAFKSGFCPRAVPGILIKYLMNNELKSSISWKLHQHRVFRNQVSFGVGPADIILKILPTHIQVSFDPRSRISTMNEVNITCEEAYKQIKRVMNDMIRRFHEHDYFFAFKCTLPECKERPHPAAIEWDTNKLECKLTDRKSDLPDGYEIWTQINASQQEIEKRLDTVLDAENNGVPLHLGQIADSMFVWEGPIADQLGLTPTDVAAIKTRYPGELKLQTRAALEEWKQRHGSSSTYNNLIKVFEQAGFVSFADTVKGLMKSEQTGTNNSDRNTFNGTSPPSEQPSQLSVFPPEPEQCQPPPPYATAAGAKLLQQDHKLRLDPGKSTRLKVPEIEVLDDTSSSQSHSSEDDEASFEEIEYHGVMDPCHDGTAQSDATNHVTGSSIDSTETFTSSLMESPQIFSTSDSAHQNQSHTKLSSPLGNDDCSLKRSKLGVESQLGTRPSGLMENTNSSMKQNKLGAKGQSDIKQSDSLESGDSILLKPGVEAQSDTKQLKKNDTLLKESKLGAEVQSDSKQAGSLKNDDSVLKQNNVGAKSQLDTKQSGSLKKDDALLKQNLLESEDQSDTKQSGPLMCNDSSLKQNKDQSGTKQSGLLHPLLNRINVGAKSPTMPSRILMKERDLDYSSVDNCTILCEDDFREVHREIRPLMENYHTLGIELGLPIQELSKIKKGFPHALDQAFSEMLLIWLKHSYNVERYGPPTWRRLVEAVDSEVGGNNHALAKKIASNHPTDLDYSSVDHCTILCEDDFREVHREIRPLMENYHTLGIELGLPIQELSKIKKGFPHALDQAFSEMLLIWLKHSYNVERYGPPTWQRLVEAVDSDNHALAKKIASNHPTVSGQTMSSSPSKHQEVPNIPQGYSKNKASSEETDEPSEPNTSCISSRESHRNHTVPFTAVQKVQRTRTMSSVMEDKGDWPSIMQKHRDTLATSYIRQVDDRAWPPVKATNFINLALVKDRRGGRKTIRGAVDKTINKGDAAFYSTIFDDIETDRFILFEGVPGSGKTTLMSKISRDWACREILKSYLLLLVPLRRLNNKEDCNIRTILQVAYPGFPESDLEQLAIFIEQNQGEGVVFAFDGLDEYVPHFYDPITKLKEELPYGTKKPLRRQLSDFFAGSTKQTIDDIFQIMYGKSFTKALVIVTSRPSACAEFREYAKKRIKVLGFLKAQITDYIHHYFDKDEDKAKHLLLHLEQHPNLMNMAYLPLHCAMLAFLYEEDTLLPETETEFYKFFTISTLLRDMRKRQGGVDISLKSFDCLAAGDKATFDKICELAFNATVKSKQVFTADDVRSISTFTNEDAGSLGLVVVDHCFTKYGLDGTYTFLHLTFQEYLAAVHITGLTDAQKIEFIKKHRRDKHLSVVWKFLCGMINFTSPSAMDVFKILLDTAAAKDKLFQLQCCHESQNSLACKHMVSASKAQLKFNSINFNPSDCTAIGYAVYKSDEEPVQLVFNDCNFSYEGVIALMQKVEDHSVSITLKKGPAVNSFLEALAECVTSGLHYLTLSGNNLNDDGAELLGKGLKRCTSIIKLDLSDNKIGPNGAQDLADGLEYCTELQELNLSNNSLADKGVIFLSNAIKEMENLKKLYLNKNFIGSEGMEALSESIEKLTTLQELSLNKNSIDDKGVISLSEVVEEMASLQRLDLNSNYIGKDGQEAISEAATQKGIKINLKYQYAGL